MTIILSVSFSQHNINEIKFCGHFIFDVIDVINKSQLSLHSSDEGDDVVGGASCCFSL